MPVASTHITSPGSRCSMRFLLLFGFVPDPIHCAKMLFCFCRFIFYAPFDPYATDHHAKILSSNDVTCCLCASESTSEEHKLTIARGGLFARS